MGVGGGQTWGLISAQGLGGVRWGWGQSGGASHNQQGCWQVGRCKVHPGRKVHSFAQGLPWCIMGSDYQGARQPEGMGCRAHQINDFMAEVHERRTWNVREMI